MYIEGTIAATHGMNDGESAIMLCIDCHFHPPESSSNVDQLTERRNAHSNCSNNNIMSNKVETTILESVLEKGKRRILQNENTEASNNLLNESSHPHNSSSSSSSSLPDKKIESKVRIL